MKVDIIKHIKNKKLNKIINKKINKIINKIFILYFKLYVYNSIILFKQ